MDSHDIDCHRGHRHRNRGWDLASPRAFFNLKSVSFNNQVRCSTTIIFFLTYSYSIPPPKQFILNDTSLAAVSEVSGNRYLFLQDPTGLIRGVVRTDNQWSTSLNLGINSNAKNHTPLAAVAPKDQTGNFAVLVIAK